MLKTVYLTKENAVKGTTVIIWCTKYTYALYGRCIPDSIYFNRAGCNIAAHS
jgi:hypothetical protein